MPLINNTTKSNQFNWDNQEFKKWAKARATAIDYYNGDTIKFTKAWLSDNIIRNVPINNNNITKRIIDRISLVYTEDTTRIASDDNYNNYIPNKDSQLLIAERRLNLLNVITLVISWRNNNIEYDVLDEFIPEYNDDVLIAISYPITAIADNIKGQLWIRITDSEFRIFDKRTGKTISVTENIFGILPVIFAFTGKPTAKILSIEPELSLVQANEAINVLSSDMNANVRYQSFGVAYATGFEEDQSIEVLWGPEKLTLLPPDSTMGILAPPDTVQSVKEAIKFNYQVAAQNYHLPVGFVEGSTQAESGISLRLRNTELLDQRKQSVKLWRGIENRIFNIEKEMLAVTAGLNLKDEFSVDFGENAIILSADEQRDQDDYNISHNFTTEAQIMIRNNPDRFDSEADAQNLIDKNRKANAKNSPTNLTDLIGEL